MSNAVPKVELIYEKTCPNIGPARELLRAAFKRMQLSDNWIEWEVSSPDVPEHCKGYGSPTILIDGNDITGEQPNDNNACCRIYIDNAALKGIPELERVMAALRASLSKR